jgi:ribosome-associated protein
MEDPLPITRELALPLAEVTLRASRSSGPGGQHANVTASRIEAVFDVTASPTLTDAQRERLLARCGPLVTAVAQDARSRRATASWRSSGCARGSPRRSRCRDRARRRGPRPPPAGAPRRPSDSAPRASASGARPTPRSDARRSGAP